ncbi:MAG: hypothetical protein ACOYNY_20380 [Caldilineaceae bacterium]
MLKNSGQELSQDADMAVDRQPAGGDQFLNVAPDRDPADTQRLS